MSAPMIDTANRRRAAWSVDETATLARQMESLLPHTHSVVAAPTILGCAFDAIVVGLAEIVVLHLPQTGRSRLAERKQTLQTFLEQEWPDLRLRVHHWRIDGTEISASGHGGTGMTPQRAAALIVADQAANGTRLDRSLHLELVKRLGQPTLDPSQSAAEPFLFRTGGRKAANVADAVRIMDANRDDGVFHLRNGSLIPWLEAAGAPHLAQVAREVMQRHGAEPQVALETFLIQTGMVARPRLRVVPRTIDLGSILVGQRSACFVRIQKEKGRGYLHGTIRSPHSWLRISPDTFSGERLDAVVRVDIESLAIRPDPYQTTIEIASNATVEPLLVPVRFRVMPLPSSLHLRLLRPLVGAATFGLVGVILGLLLALWGPIWGGLGGAAWIGLIGLVWALCGGLVGARQPLEWTARQVSRRRLTWLAGWTAGLFLMVSVLLGGWDWVAADLDLPLAPVPFFTGALLAAALAAVPAAWQELRAGDSRSHAAIPLPRSHWQWAAPLLVPLVLTLVLLGGVRLLGTTWQHYQADGTVEAVQVQVEDQWVALEGKMNGWMDEQIIRYYEGRRSGSSLQIPEWVQRWWRRLIY